MNHSSVFRFLASGIISEVTKLPVGEPYCRSDDNMYLMNDCYPLTTENKQYIAGVQETLEKKFPRNLFGPETKTFVDYGVTSVIIIVLKI